jgi:hypothetical protein
MKTNLTNWLSALCAVLLIVLLVLQNKQKSQLETLQQAHEAFASVTEQRQQEVRDANAKLASQVTNLGASMEARLTQSKQQAEAFLNKLQEQGSTNSAEMLQAIFQVSYDLRDKLTNELAAADARNQQSADALVSRVEKEMSEMKAGMGEVLAEHGRQLQAFTNGLLAQQSSFISGIESRMTRNEQLNAENLATMTNTIFQQTAVMHRALGKVIPVELPESLTNQLAALEARIADENSWPKDSTNTDAMVAELRSLIHQIPPWAEEDYLPRLNALRWAVQSLDVIQANATAQGEDLDAAADAYANQLAIQPDGGATNIAAVLTGRQQDATNRYAAIRFANAINEATNNLSLAVMDDSLAAAQWQNLAEWINDPAAGPQAIQLRHQLHARLLEDDTSKFIASVDAGLAQASKESSLTIRQISFGKILDSVLSQRQILLETPDADPRLSRSTMDVAMRIEKAIEADGKSQEASQEMKMHEYQRWALTQIWRFNSDMNVDEKGDKGFVHDSPDYPEIKNDMVKYLVPISVGLLDPAVSRLYNQAFERGWHILENRKDLQTEVAKQEAVVQKHKP